MVEGFPDSVVCGVFVFTVDCVCSGLPIFERGAWRHTSFLMILLHVIPMPGG